MRVENFLVCVLVALAVSAVSVEASRKMETTFADRSRLFFHAVDTNRDGRISSQEALAATPVLEKHMPGVSEDEFLSFLEVSDVDKDLHMDLPELLRGLKVGIASLVETGARAQDENMPPKPVVLTTGTTTTPVNPSSEESTEESSEASTPMENFKVDNSQDTCILCQYITERLISDVQASGVMPPDHGRRPDRGTFSFLETEATFLPPQKPDFGNHDPSQPPINNLLPGHHDYYDALETQLYNEIFHITDLTLDHVCESGMPNDYYELSCKLVFEDQAKIVSHIARQFSALNICLEIDLCTDKSYISEMTHTPMMTRPEEESSESSEGSEDAEESEESSEGPEIDPLGERPVAQSKYVPRDIPAEAKESSAENSAIVMKGRY